MLSCYDVMTQGAEVESGLTGKYCVNGRMIISELFEDEVVAVNFETGSYYGMSGAAMDAWRLLQNSASPGELSDYLGRRYAAPDGVIARDVSEFLQRLMAEKLILEGSQAEASPLPETPQDERRPWQKPELSVYEDMQDLLLLDPVHDVDETGWPARKPDLTG